MNEANKEDITKAFYSRQILLKELGIIGQDKLAKSKVAVVGVGGLGTVSSLYLALAGVGCIRLIDYDLIAIHNLHRQILYSLRDVNQAKAKIAAKQLLEYNPMITVETISEKLIDENAAMLLAGVDCVIDGLDNRLTRYAVNRTCANLDIPYVFGAAIGLEGNVSVFAPPETGCLECAFPQHYGNDQPSSKFGIIGATPGIVGSLQAMEAIKLLSGVGQPLKGKLLVCDFSDMNFTMVTLHKNLDCPVCSNPVSK